MRPPLVRDTPCPHCSSLYILGSLSRHAKSAHLLANFISQTNDVFYFCRCTPFLCFSLVLFLLLLGVCFELSLAPFWGCLSFVSLVFICFIGSFEPARMRLGRLFAYLLTKLFKTQQINQHGSFSSCCFISVCAICEEVNEVNKKFLLASGGLW
jgi:hypothetical protein